MLRALTRHPTLKNLDLRFNGPVDAGAAGVALGALVAADAPSLTGLRIGSSDFGDFGLEPIVDALRHNTHLRLLDCCNVSMSRQFAHERFLPAVRANTSLHALRAGAMWDNDEDGVAPRAVLGAEALVAARARAATRVR